MGSNTTPSAICAGTVAVTTNGTVNTGAAGTHTVSYLAADPGGNSGTNTRTVNVPALSPVQFVPTSTAGVFSFPTVSGQSYTVEESTNLASTNRVFLRPTL